MYWSNVPQAVVSAQRRVFEYLGIELEQQRADGLPHGEWMDAVLNDAAEDDVVVMVDVDAFPLSRNAYDRSVAIAQAGSVFGLAQSANHLPSRDQIYAGPMYLAVSKSTWTKVGRPSMRATHLADAGQALTTAAQAHGHGVTLIMPTACMIPRWALADRGVFGIGTFYGECEFFHLFESRAQAHGDLMVQVASDVATGRKLDFVRYLSATSPMPVEASAVSRARQWLGRKVAGRTTR
jgi:hypothetical protein